MAVRKLKPTTPGQRHKVIGVFDEITARTPEKSLTVGKDAQADATPKVTARHAMSAAATSVNSVLSTSREQKTVCQRP